MELSCQYGEIAQYIDEWGRRWYKQDGNNQLICQDHIVKMDIAEED